MQNFSRSHFSTLIKYIGISFITGAIAHGFFSGTRQIITAIIGVVLFIIGTLLEEWTSNMKTIALSALLAIAIGAITWGLQHFPDSPERSAWILPLGLIASIPLYALVHEMKIDKRWRIYSIIATIVTLLITLALYTLIESYGLAGHSHSEEAPWAIIREITPSELSPKVEHATWDTHIH
jgi:hypothetical protein